MCYINRKISNEEVAPCYIHSVNHTTDRQKPFSVPFYLLFASLCHTKSQLKDKFDIQ